MLREYFILYLSIDQIELKGYHVVPKPCQQFQVIYEKAFVTIIYNYFAHLCNGSKAQVPEEDGGLRGAKNVYDINPLFAGNWSVNENGTTFELEIIDSNTLKWTVTMDNMGGTRLEGVSKREKKTAAT